MTLSTVELYRYALPLRPPLQVRGEEFRYREGVLLGLRADAGLLGWGEAAPLSGFSAETLDEVLTSARALASELEGVSTRESNDLSAVFQSLPLEENCSPSLQFALESAVVDLLAEDQDLSLAEALGEPEETIALNALMANPLEKGEEKASQLRDAGYEAVKVKVGRGSVEEEAECIRRLHRVLGEGVALRLDANRAWSMEEAIAFADLLADVPIAYLEEPLAEPGTLEALASRISLPLALDETTREASPEILRRSPFLAAVVLKPTLLGGISTTRRWIRHAQVNDCLPVVSASYESGVGLRMLASLAATLPATPVGLSTYDRLAADVLTPRLPIGGPSVNVKALLSSPVDLNRSFLTPIDLY